MLTSLWKDLGFADGFRRILRRKRTFDVEKLLRVMVFNRLCDPESKQGILRWMEQALVPDIEEESVTHQHLLRTMDTLFECSEMLEEMLAKLLRPLIDQEIAIVIWSSSLRYRQDATESLIRSLAPFTRSSVSRLLQRFWGKRSCAVFA